MVYWLPWLSRLSSPQCLNWIVAWILVSQDWPWHTKWMNRTIYESIYVSFVPMNSLQSRRCYNLHRSCVFLGLYLRGIFLITDWILTLVKMLVFTWLGFILSKGPGFLVLVERFLALSCWLLLVKENLSSKNDVCLL